MSKPLTREKIYEDLQRVLHDLHDLSIFGDKQPFRGIVITHLPIQYRDEGMSFWTIRFEPAVPAPGNMPQSAMTQPIFPAREGEATVARDEITEGEQDEEIRTEPQG